MQEAGEHCLLQRCYAQTTHIIGCEPPTNYATTSTDTQDPTLSNHTLDTFTSCHPSSAIGPPA